MTCSIQLDNYRGQYRPGETIIGRVVFTFSKSENVRGIVLILKGEEKNEWSTGSGDDSSTCVGRNKILRVVNALQNGGDIGLGRFEYPFTFQLPSDLPSTYKGHYGGISYFIEVKVDRSFKVDYTDTKEIIIFSPIDLNLMKDKLELKPVSYSIDETQCSLCCDSGTITMDVHLQKKAFVVGEVVDVKVEINNMSNQDIAHLSVKLEMVVKSMVFENRSGMFNHKLFDSNIGERMEAHKQGTYNFSLKIPELAQIPNFNLCKLFSQETLLKVKAVLHGCNTNLKIKLHITLGHIPVNDPSAPGCTIEDALTSTPTQNPIPGPIGFGDRPSAPPSEDSAPPKGEVAENRLAAEEVAPPSYDDVMFSDKHFSNAY